MTPAEVIEMLKSEIARYESLKRTEEAWAYLYRREEAARSTRDLFQLAFLDMEKRAKAGDLPAVLAIAAEVRAMSIEADGSLKKEWWNGLPDHPEDPAPSQRAIDFRRDAWSKLHNKWGR